MTLSTLVLGNCGIFYSMVMQDLLHQQDQKGSQLAKYPCLCLSYKKVLGSDFGERLSFRMPAKQVMTTKDLEVTQNV